MAVLAHDAAAAVLDAPSHIDGAVLMSVAIGTDGADTSALHGEERAIALALPVARRPSFVAGRIALRAAVRRVAPQLHDVPLLRTVRGGPQLPHGLTGSVSHKRHRAIAVVAPWLDGGARERGERHVGIDLEERWMAREVSMARDGERADARASRSWEWAMRLGRRILTHDELVELESRVGADVREASTLDSSRIGSAVLAPLCDEILTRFAVKEAIYKAIDPIVHRYVRFDEVEAVLQRDGRVAVGLLLPEAQASTIHVAAEWRMDDAYITASAECRR